MKTILVAVDFSPITDSLIEAAMRAAKPESKIYIVHVAAPDPDFVGYSVGPNYIREDRAEQLKEEHKLLAEYKDRVLIRGLDAEALLIAGPTVETLLEEIEKLDVNLLVIGKKGHSTLYEVVFGSVCKIMLEKVNIPALVIPVLEEDE